MLFKEIVDARTDARTHARTTDDGRRTPDIEGSQKLTEHFVLRWAKKEGGSLILSFLAETDKLNHKMLISHLCKISVLIWKYNMSTYFFKIWPHSL